MWNLHFLDSELLSKCFLLIIFTYAGFIAVIEISIYHILIPVLLYYLILYISLPSPESKHVNRILGVNPRTLLRDADDEKFTSDAVDDVVFCIAYRAASFDSMENNLDAIRQVSCIFYSVYNIY